MLQDSVYGKVERVLISLPPLKTDLKSVSVDCLPVLFDLVLIFFTLSLSLSLDSSFFVGAAALFGCFWLRSRDFL